VVFYNYFRSTFYLCFFSVKNTQNKFNKFGYFRFCVLFCLIGFWFWISDFSSAVAFFVAVSLLYFLFVILLSCCPVIGFSYRLYLFNSAIGLGSGDICKAISGSDSVSVGFELLRLLCYLLLFRLLCSVAVSWGVCWLFRLFCWFGFVGCFLLAVLFVNCCALI